MNSDTKDINIFFKNTDQQRGVLDTATPHEKYIILMNGTLHETNKELSEQVTSLSDTVAELEEDNRRMEISKTYMKGLLKNFAEVDKLRVKTTLNDEEQVKHIQCIHMKMKNEDTLFRSGWVGCVIGLITLIYFTMDSTPIEFFILFCGVILDFVLMTGRKTPDMKKAVFGATRKAIMDEITEITKGQDFLYEHLDAL